MDVHLFTGGTIDIERPMFEQIHIEDIAHSLAYQCRFAGHTKKFYSVAEHSVILSHLTSPESRLWALFHDGAEAYMGDVIRPVRYALPGLEPIERKLLQVIAIRFMLDSSQPPMEVNQADGLLTLTELKDLLNGIPDPALDFKKVGDPGKEDFARFKNIDYHFLPPEGAERAFMYRYEILIEERNDRYETFRHPQV